MRGYLADNSLPAPAWHLAYPTAHTVKPVMEGLVVGTGEQQLGAPYPAGVYWTARSDATKANA